MFTAIENALYPVVCDLNAYLSNYVLVFLLIFLLYGDDQFVVITQMDIEVLFLHTRSSYLYGVLLLVFQHVD